MLVRNLQKKGDYQKSIISQEENLRLAIQNDKNIADARKKQKAGIVPEFTRKQNRISEQVLTDALEIKIVALNNLRSIFTEEQANKFVNGEGKTKALSQEDLEYLNIFWDDLKEGFKSKAGLSLKFFRDILKKSAAGRRANYGYYTGRTRPAKSLAINTTDELKTTFPRENLLNQALKIVVRIGQTIPEAKAIAEDLNLLKKYFPTSGDRQQKIPRLPFPKQQEYYQRFQQVFDGWETDPKEWEKVLMMNDREIVAQLPNLYPDMIDFEERVTKLYEDLKAEPDAVIPEAVPRPRAPIVEAAEAVVRPSASLPPVSVPPEFLPVLPSEPVLTRPKVKSKKPVPEPVPEPEPVIEPLEPEPDLTKPLRRGSEAQDMLQFLASIEERPKFVQFKDEEMPPPPPPIRRQNIDIEKITARVDLLDQEDEAIKRAKDFIQQRDQAAQEKEQGLMGEEESRMRQFEAEEAVQLLEQLDRLIAERKKQQQELELMAEAEDETKDFLIKVKWAQLTEKANRTNAAIVIQSKIRGKKAKEELAKLLQEKKDSEQYERMIVAQIQQQEQDKWTLLREEQKKIADTILIQSKVRGKAAKAELARLRQRNDDINALLQDIIDTSATQGQVNVAAKKAQKVAEDREKLRKSTELILARKEVEAEIKRVQETIAKIKALPPVPTSEVTPYPTLSQYEPVEVPIDEGLIQRASALNTQAQINTVRQDISNIQSAILSVQTKSRSKAAQKELARLRSEKQELETKLDTLSQSLTEQVLTEASTELQAEEAKRVKAAKAKEKREEKKATLKKYQEETAAREAQAAEAARQEAETKAKALADLSQRTKAIKAEREAKQAAEEAKKAEDELRAAETALEQDKALEAAILFVQSKTRSNKAKRELAKLDVQRKELIDRIRTLPPVPPNLDLPPYPTLTEYEPVEIRVDKKKEVKALRDDILAYREQRNNLIAKIKGLPPVPTSDLPPYPILSEYEPVEIGFSKPAKRRAEMALSSLEYGVLQERKEELINRLMTQWTALGLVKSDPRLEEFVDNHNIFLKEENEFGEKPLTEKNIDEFILKTKQEEDQLKKDLALAERDAAKKIDPRIAAMKAVRDKTKGKSKEEIQKLLSEELDRQAAEAERDAAISAAKQQARDLLKTKVSKQKEVSEQRKKEKAEMLEYSKKLDKIEQERKAAEAALLEAQLSQPAAELEQRAAAETPKRGRPTAPRPKGLTKAQREARDAEQKAKLIQLETEEVQTQAEADVAQMRIDAAREKRLEDGRTEMKRLIAEKAKRLADNKAEMKRLASEKTEKTKALKEAKDVLARKDLRTMFGQRTEVEIASFRADSYRLDDEIAADEARMEKLKQQMDEKNKADQDRMEALKRQLIEDAAEQKKRVKEIRAELERRTERNRRRTASQETLRKALIGQAERTEDTIRRRGISAELERRANRDKRRSLSQELTLQALSGQQKRDAEEKALKAEQDALAKVQRDAEKASKAKKTESTPSPLAFVGKAFSAVKQASKQVGKNLRGRTGERAFDIQEQSRAAEAPATGFEVALATASSRAKAEQNRLEREARERLARSKSPSALLSKEAADELKRRGEVSQVTQAKPRPELSFEQKRKAVIEIKDTLDEIQQGVRYPQSLNKTLYAILQDPTQARDAFRRLRLTPEEQSMFDITESDVIPKKGRGISLKPKSFVEFGRFKLNENMLEEGTLQVKTQNGSPVPTFSKKIAISDTLQSIILDLIETQKLRGVSDLDDEERRLLETLLIKAGLAQGLGIKKVHQSDEDAKKVQRFDLVKGIYEAGNNSIEVIHELRSLILYFIKTKRLNRKQGIEALQELQ